MFRYPLSEHDRPSPPPTSRSPPMLPFDAPKKSLTPLRKHHKLLKDGSEVWSHDVEEIFVEGLHKYWESPWATYSRGRSRWRNQFLVDHLKKAGILRSKKQVASHIQVLRNMWRGEPEFHLVAGGEELFQDNGLLAPKAKASTESPEPRNTLSLDSADSTSSYSSSSSSSTPDWSTLEFPFDFNAPLTSSHMPEPPVLNLSDFNYDLHLRPSSSAQSMPDSPFATITPSTSRKHVDSSVKLEPLIMDPALFNLPQGPLPETFEFPYPSPTLPAPSTNRVCSVNLWADGMLPFSIDVDRLVSASLIGPPSSSPPFRILLRINVRCLASDIHAPGQPAAGAQGFHGAIAFAAPWVSAKCHTKTWDGGACIGHEVGIFDPLTTPQYPPDLVDLGLGLGANSTSNAGAGAQQMVIAYLPDSLLSRCKNIESIQTITQQVVVDNEVLAVVVYHVERVQPPAPAPAVELVGFHKYPWRTPVQVPGPSPLQRPSASVAAASAFVTPPMSPVSPGRYSGPVSPEYVALAPSGEDPRALAHSPMSCALSFSRSEAMYGISPSVLEHAGLF
ncbi:hypothetical protein SCP_0406070 [Sparassis crispa]|uniref:TEA domain-containing protein n=1 Tax=Sparassis crispa TaxID=139825 RepID=A0A401GJ39_9APHY|nr:hypothetical protein SCP_0406070 [Sparassis crispa]GBE82224.1 hypothetical protein SCP_0406070 [Sparassis crispa]